MSPPSLNIKPPTHPDRLFRRVRVVGVRHGEPATEDQVRRYAGVFVRRVVGIAGKGGQSKRWVSVGGWTEMFAVAFLGDSRGAFALCFHMQRRRELQLSGGT